MASLKSGFNIGVDEVGRGPIAGPLLLCACKRKVGARLPEKILNAVQVGKSSFKDSKRFSEKKRKELFEILKAEDSLEFFTVSFSASELDRVGLSKALKCGVLELLQKAGMQDKDEIFLDGSLHCPENYPNCRTIVKGDEKVLEVALASLFAKVTRDEFMISLAKKYPDYDFEKHKGYGTRDHFEKLRLCGITPQHRKSFLKNFNK